jgi:hypothetical protein
VRQSRVGDLGTVEAERELADWLRENSDDE